MTLSIFGVPLVGILILALSNRADGQYVPHRHREPSGIDGSGNLDGGDGGGD